MGRFPGSKALVYVFLAGFLLTGGPGCLCPGLTGALSKKESRSRLPSRTGTNKKPKQEPRRRLKHIPEKYRNLCGFERGAKIRIETESQAGIVKFLKCTSLGVKAENEEKETGLIMFKRIRSVTLTAAEELEKLETQPAPPVTAPMPQPKPVVAAEPAAPKMPAGTPEAAGEIPDSGAMVFSNLRVFWGMGYADQVSDPYSARRRSAKAARSELVDLFIVNLYIFTGIPDDEQEAKISSFKKAIIKKSVIVDRWTDVENDRHFSVAVLPADDCGLESNEAILLWDLLSRGQKEAR